MMILSRPLQRLAKRMASFVSEHNHLGPKIFDVKQQSS